jgi:predicted Zn-dependent peptidase
MKTMPLALLLVAACAATPPALPMQGQETPAHPDKLSYPPLDFKVPDPATFRTKLANGMTVYAIEDHSLPLVEIRIQARGGSFWQPKGKEGLASACGQLMRTGGTTTREPDVLDERIDFLAAQLGVAIADVTASANLSVLSKDLDEGLALFVDVLRNPGFKQEKLDLYKKQVMRALQGRNDATAGIEGREANLLFYGDYPVNAHPTNASVESITREDLLAFHTEVFYPSNFIVAAAGDFDRAAFLKKLEAACAGWENPKDPPARTIPKVAHVPPPGVFAVHKEGRNINQGRVTIGHLGIDLRDPDLHALRIMAYILGAGGFSSRLTQRVRTEEGLAYDVGCSYPPGIAYTSTFRIQFQSKSESCLYAAKLCLEELEKMRTKEVDPKELEDAVNFYLDGFPGFFFSTKFQTASTFANAEINDYPPQYFQSYRPKIKAVTAADVLRVAKERIDPSKLVFVFVGNMTDIRKGDGKHELTLEQFGKVTDVPLPDPMTLERPKQ